MNAIDDPEVKRYRVIRGAVGAVILAGFLAGLAAIGAQAPERRYVTLNCAYDPAATGTLTDAVSEIPSACAPAAADEPRATAPTQAGPHGVPDAAAVAFPAAGDDPQPPTF
ncbi:MAG: hypothetical protein C3F16_07285 [Betaproteobacteria bacterium]|nr:MAG: hypothetical protein C3F16_07285 [Betaproteobacteria bacterium]